MVNCVSVPIGVGELRCCLLCIISVVSNMKKGKELSTELKHTIISLALRGYSLRKIGNIVKKPHSTVSYIVNKFKYNGSIKNIPRRSRESFLNEREKRFIVNKVKVNPRVTAPEIVQMLQQASGKKVSSQTVRRVLWQHGYRGRIPRKRPCVSKKNRAARLAFAKEHQDKPQTFWNTVIWSDETKINLFGSDGIQTVWRKANTADNVENTLPTVKHGGGSIKLWGCMSSKGVGTIHFIDDNLNKWGYLNILKNNVKQSVEKMGLSASYMFQQDNDPKHTAEINKLWLIWNVPKQLRTPAQSADLNPIEHLWPILKRRVRKCKVTSKEDLKEVILKTWEEIKPATCLRLVQSMQRRCRAVLKARGYSTKY